VRRLVLANAVCYDSWPIPSVRALRAAGPVTGRLPMPAFKALVARGHDDPAIVRESLALHLEPYRCHGGAAALAWQVRWLRTADTLQVADWQRDLQLPVRVVWGAADPFQRLPYGQRLAWDLRTELRRIEGGRRFVPEDHPSGWPSLSTRSSAPSASADPGEGSWRRAPPVSLGAAISARPLLARQAAVGVLEGAETV
jgi:pimeloyl-ACP methyl ester carboxylesterase